MATVWSADFTVAAEEAKADGYEDAGIVGMLKNDTKLLLALAPYVPINDVARVVCWYLMPVHGVHLRWLSRVAMPRFNILNCVSFNVSNGLIAFGGDTMSDANGLLQLLKFSHAGLSGDLNLSLPAHPTDVVLVDWNEQHQRLATADRDGLIIVWMPYTPPGGEESWYEEMINNRNSSRVVAIKWSRDGAKICILYADGLVIIGSVHGQRLWAETLKWQLSTVAWSADNTHLLLGTADGQVVVYSVIQPQGKRFVATVPIAASVFGKDPNAAELVGLDWFGGVDGGSLDIHITLCYSSGCIQFMRHHTDPAPIVVDTGMELRAMRWNSEMSILAVAGTANHPQVQLFHRDRCTVQRIGTFSLPQDAAIASLSWNHDSTRLALAVGSHLVMLQATGLGDRWLEEDIQQQPVFHALGDSTTMTLEALAGVSNVEKDCVVQCGDVNTQANHLAVGIGKRVVIYDISSSTTSKTPLQNKRMLHNLSGHKSPVTAVSYAHPSQQRLASAGEDQIVLIWSISGSMYQGILKYMHSSPLRLLAYNLTTHVLASCADSDWGLWRPLQKQVEKQCYSGTLSKIFGSPRKALSCAWNDRGGEMLSMGLDCGGVMHWSMTTGKQCFTIKGQTGLNTSPGGTAGSAPACCVAWTRVCDDGPAVATDAGRGARAVHDNIGVIKSAFAQGMILVVAWGSDAKTQAAAAETKQASTSETTNSNSGGACLSYWHKEGKEQQCVEVPIEYEPMSMHVVGVHVVVLGSDRKVYLYRLNPNAGTCMKVEVLADFKFKATVLAVLETAGASHPKANTEPSGGSLQGNGDAALQLFVESAGQIFRLRTAY